MVCFSVNNEIKIEIFYEKGKRLLKCLKISSLLFYEYGDIVSAAKINYLIGLVQKQSFD